MSPETWSKHVTKARRCLQAARALAALGMPDFAASRAYYAMFYVAQAMLLSKDIRLSRHSAVVAAFGQHFAKTGATHAHLHRTLIAAFALRQSGDYDYQQIDDESAERVMRDAAEFIKAAETYLASTQGNSQGDDPST